MRPEDKDLAEKAKHWVELGEEDLRVAKYSLTMSSNVPYRIIAFHAQQCAEKYIKALLVLLNIDFPYTHDIEKLLKMIPEKFNIMPQMMNAGDLTDYAVAKRYPDYYEKLSEEQALNALKLAEMIKEKISSIIREMGYGSI